MTTDSPFLTDVMWLTIGAACLGWCWVVLRPRIGADLEHIAEAWLRHRRRTAIDRMARQEREAARARHPSMTGRTDRGGRR